MKGVRAGITLRRRHTQIGVRLAARGVLNMEMMEAICGRRSVRAYTDQPVEPAIVRSLIRAAIQAPSAMNRQPWAFAVVQDPALLKEWSDRAKAHFLQTLDGGHHADETRALLTNPAYSVFYDAGTLIIVLARQSGPWVAGDCCLAAENLMLAATAMGLATCPIGFAQPWLNLPVIKREIGIPHDYEVVLPIIVGYARQTPPAPPRYEPEMAFWKRENDRV